MELKQIRELVELELNTDLINTSRKREIVYARNLYFKLAKDYTNFPYSEIGNEIGKNHATVIHGYKTCTEVMLKFDAKFIESHRKLTRILNRITNDPLKYIESDSYYRDKYKEALLDTRLALNRERALRHKYRYLLSQMKHMNIGWAFKEEFQV